MELNGRLVGVVCWDLDEVESISLVKAVERQGGVPVPFVLSDVRRINRNGEARVVVGAHDVESFAAVLARAQFRAGSLGQDADQYALLASTGTPLSESLEAYLLSESKVRSYIQLGKAGVRIPNTSLVGTMPEIKALHALHGAIVLKPSYGYGGRDVELLGRSADEPQHRVVESLLERHGTLIAQNYIPHPNGDYRVTVIDGRVVFCVRRVPNHKTWKANISLGADVLFADAPREVQQVALAAASAIGLRVSGVDVLHEDGVSHVLEVNNNPGWTDYDEEQRIRIATLVLQAMDEAIIARRGRN